MRLGVSGTEPGFRYETMSTQAPSEFQGTDLELPSDATKLGVDGNGAAHYYSRIANEVFVSERDGTTRTFDLDATPCDGPSDWTDHVHAQRGDWRDLRYRDGNAFAHLAKQLGRLD